MLAINASSGRKEEERRFYFNPRLVCLSLKYKARLFYQCTLVCIIEGLMGVGVSNYLSVFAAETALPRKKCWLAKRLSLSPTWLPARGGGRNRRRKGMPQPQCFPHYSEKAARRGGLFKLWRWKNGEEFPQECISSALISHWYMYEYELDNLLEMVIVCKFLLSSCFKIFEQNPFSDSLSGCLEHITQDPGCRGRNNTEAGNRQTRGEGFL